MNHNFSTFLTIFSTILLFVSCNGGNYHIPDNVTVIKKDDKDEPSDEFPEEELVLNKNYQNDQDSLEDYKGYFKVGNPYQIEGRTYYPKIDENYDEVGVASWYGEQFHLKKTANGELFDKNLFSAAHKTLPMPIIVKVTNLENGKSMYLRMNDRGPFSKERIIDLSMAAAKALGFHKQGTTKVRVQYVEKATIGKMATGPKDIDYPLSDFDERTVNNASSSDVQIANKTKSDEDGFEKNTYDVAVNENGVSSKNGNKLNNKKLRDVKYEDNNSNNYYEYHELKKGEKQSMNVENSDEKNFNIQVGAFTDIENAKNYLEKIENDVNLGAYSAFVEELLRNGKTLYLVKIGSFILKNDANKFGEYLNNLGIDNVIMSKEK